MADRTIDLEALGLRSGQAVRIDMEISPEPPVLGGERLELETDPISLRVDISRTSSGFALRLRGEAVVLGTCARCLGPARLVVEIDAREVEQAGVDPDDELSSPYVDEALLDPEAWLHDALALGIPERLICRPDCAGLCAICGISLNEVTTGSPRPRTSSRSPLREAAGPPGLEPPGGGDARTGSPATIPAPWQSRRNVNRARAATSAAPTTRSRPLVSTSARIATARGCRIASARPAEPTPVARSSPATRPRRSSPDAPRGSRWRPRRRARRAPRHLTG